MISWAIDRFVAQARMRPVIGIVMQPFSQRLSTLSGGQKKRVLLARALYYNPQILFIDEGTAHLGPKSEESVLQTLISPDLSIVVVAHRSKSIEKSNRILNVDNGYLTRNLPEKIRRQIEMKSNVTDNL